MILALDPARNFGWAAGEPGTTPRWGVVFLTGETTGAIGMSLRGMLGRLFAEFLPDLVSFEAPYLPRPRRRGNGGGTPANALTIRRLNGYAFTIETACAEARVRVVEVTPSEVSQFFLGTGHRLKRGAKKIATIEMCRQYGWAVSDDNEADALSIWAITEATIAPELGRLRGEGPLFLQPKNAPGLAGLGSVSPSAPIDGSASTWPSRLTM